ncbi:MAG: carbohydrate ABC transporter permease [Oscillospiraceae bacterium]|jgi:multiple sugar transport system permease protein|nr:carbohydrate ABC transporter permease [Oscillospiraceae bacterium]
MIIKSKWYYRVLQRALVLAMLALAVVPVYIVVSNSFRRALDIKRMPPKLFFDPILTHYSRVLSVDSFARYFINSLIIAGCTTATVILLGTLAAYGLRLFRSRLGLRLSNIMMLGKLVPSITILIPLYIMLNRMRLTGLYIAPILAHAAISVPFVTWLMRGFIEDIPTELLESATEMGATRMQTFFVIILPLLLPAVASAVILTMQSSWNELLFSLTLTNIKTYPLTVAVARFTGAMSVDWGKCSAAATITLVPIVLLGFFMQKYLVTGMTAGAVKG